MLLSLSKTIWEGGLFLHNQQQQWRQQQPCPWTMHHHQGRLLRCKEHLSTSEISIRTWSRRIWYKFFGRWAHWTQFEFAEIECLASLFATPTSISSTLRMVISSFQLDKLSIIFHSFFLCFASLGSVLFFSFLICYVFMLTNFLIKWKLLLFFLFSFKVIKWKLNGWIWVPIKLYDVCSAISPFLHFSPSPFGVGKWVSRFDSCKYGGRIVNVPNFFSRAGLWVTHLFALSSFFFF